MCGQLGAEPVSVLFEPRQISAVFGLRSAAFLTTYQDRRGRRFTVEEQEIAWAASLWPAAHNARWEALHDDPPISGGAVRAQGAERLRRANA